MTAGFGLVQPSDDDLKAGLRRIGLGSRYAHKKLSECGPTGETLAMWCKGDEFVTEVRSGYGRSMHGGAVGHDIFMALARATYLRGVRSKVVSMSVLVNEVVGSEINLDLLEAYALFLTPFYRDDYKQPLTEYQRLAVEDFLMERLDNQRAVFTFASRPLSECRAWWSAILVERLQASNVEIEV